MSTVPLRKRTRKATRHINPLKTQHFGTFSTHLDRRLLLSDTDFRSVVGHHIVSKNLLTSNAHLLDSSTDTFTWHNRQKAQAAWGRCA